MPFISLQAPPLHGKYFSSTSPRTWKVHGSPFQWYPILQGEHQVVMLTSACLKTKYLPDLQPRGRRYMKDHTHGNAPSHDRPQIRQINHKHRSQKISNKYLPTNTLTTPHRPRSSSYFDIMHGPLAASGFPSKGAPNNSPAGLCCYLSHHIAPQDWKL